MTSQIRRVQSAFSRQASGFAGVGLNLGREELLRWVVESLPLSPATRALDIAAGTGHLSRAVAPHVGSMAAIDVTAAMLREARAEVARAGLRNLHLVRGDAGRLPFAGGHFDLVMCRLALHHFAEPAAEVAEMARVTRAAGMLAIVDLLFPDDAALATRYNTFERMRDPSHAWALTATDLRNMLVAAGCRVSSWDVRDVEVPLEPWFELTHTSASTRKTIELAFDSELDGGPPTGMRPRRREGRLSFVQTWVLAQAIPGGRSARA